MSSSTDLKQNQTQSPMKAGALKAVALKGDKTAAPQITAKGRGYTAEKILEIAFAEGVMVRQDAALTELLDLLEIDSPVPIEALHAVSLILEQVYLENERRQVVRHTKDTTTQPPQTEDKKTLDLPSLVSQNPKRLKDIQNQRDCTDTEEI